MIKTIKKIMSAVVIVSLLFITFGSKVSAGEAANIYVSGVQITSYNAHDVLGDGKVSYNFMTDVLTLNNATIEVKDVNDYDAAGIYIENYTYPVEIQLLGTNYIKLPSDLPHSDQYFGVLAINSDNVHFTSGGTLNINLSNMNYFTYHFYANTSSFFFNNVKINMRETDSVFVNGINVGDNDVKVIDSKITGDFTVAYVLWGIKCDNLTVEDSEVNIFIRKHKEQDYHFYPIGIDIENEFDLSISSRVKVKIDDEIKINEAGFAEGIKCSVVSVTDNSHLIFEKYKNIEDVIGIKVKDRIDTDANINGSISSVTTMGAIALETDIACISKNIKTNASVLVNYAPTADGAFKWDTENEIFYYNYVHIPYEDIIDTPQVKSIYNVKNGIDVRFAHVEGATAYVFGRISNGELHYFEQVDVEDIPVKYGYLNWTDTSVKTEYGKGFAYKVYALKGAIASDISDQLAIFRLNEPTITKLEAKSNSIKVTWNKEKVHRYVLQYSIDGENWKTIETTATSRNITGLKPNTTYYFRVRGVMVQKDGTIHYSQYSTRKSAKTK